jgi:hypothetical protein
MEVERIVDGSSVKENIMCIAVDFRSNSWEGLVWLRMPVVEAIITCEV